MLRSTLSLFILLAVTVAGGAVYPDQGVPSAYRARPEARSPGALDPIDAAATLDEALHAVTSVHEALRHRSAPVPDTLRDALASLRTRCRRLRRQTDHLLRQRTTAAPWYGLPERLDALEASLETAHYLTAPTYVDFAYAAFSRLDSLNQDLAWLARRIPALQEDDAAGLLRQMSALEAEYVAVWRDLGIRETPRGAAFHAMRWRMGSRIAGLGDRIRRVRRQVQRALSPPSAGLPTLQT